MLCCQMTEFHSELGDRCRSVIDDMFVFLLEFSDHEKTHMHYHLRRMIIRSLGYIFASCHKRVMH